MTCWENTCRASCRQRADFLNLLRVPINQQGKKQQLNRKEKEQWIMLG